MNKIDISKIPSETYIKKDTGEEVELAYAVTTKEELKRIEDAEKKKRDWQIKQRIEGDYDNFYFLLYKDREIFQQNIKDESIVKIIFLATHLNYNGYLVYDNGVTIRKENLQSILGVGKNAFYDFYNEMDSAEIFKEHSDGKIYLNRNNFRKGTLNTTRNHTRIFDKSIRMLYKGTNPRSHSGLAMIFKLIPYMNYHYNILCLNPREKNGEYLKFLSLSDICIILNYSNDKKKRLLETLLKFRFTLNEKKISVFKYVLDSPEIYEGIFMINPLLTYKGEISKRKEIEVLFEKDFKKMFAKLDSKQKQAIIPPTYIGKG